ncbi:hypothetical protein WJX73_006882 [Symbiochloris irregularis]|uniref:RNase H type-1 domain-containing protein n=1 Tax=Symbiochloris irregularis TaxID=706552 RepID=A0AAW1PIM9_9CHLO
MQKGELCYHVNRHLTSNQAEYAALILGLEACLDAGVTDIKVYGDNDMVAKQVAGDIQPPLNDSRLMPLHSRARSAIVRFGKWQIHWFDR